MIKSIGCRPRPPRPPASAPGPCLTSAFAASPSGLAVVGRFGGSDQPPASSRICCSYDRTRSSNRLVASCQPGRGSLTAPEQGVYGSPAPPYQDVAFPAPWPWRSTSAEPNRRGRLPRLQRVFHPRDGSADLPFGTRFMPSHRPSTSTTRLATQSTASAPSFADTFWCDLAFSADGQQFADLATTTGTSADWPDSRSACRRVRSDTLRTRHRQRRLHAVRFPDAISSVACGGGGTTPWAAGPPCVSAWPPRSGG